MATYFLDATGGNDGSTGGSQGTAWRTLTRLAAQTLNAGDVVKFKNGEVFRGATLALLASGAGGTVANPIVFQPYTLDDVLPVLDGGQLVTGWTLTAVPNVWQATVASEVNGVSVDGTTLWWTGGQQLTPWLPTTQSPAAIDIDHPWTWQSGVLYIFSATDPNARTVVANVRDVLSSDSYGGLYFQQLQLSHAQDRAALIRNRSNRVGLAPVTFDACVFSQNGFRRNSGCASINNMTGGGRITRCVFDDNTNDGAFITASPGWEVDHNTVRRVHRWESDGFQFQGNTPGVLLAGNEGMNVHHNDIDLTGSDTHKGCVLVNGPIGRYGSVHHNTLRGGNFGVQHAHSGLVTEDNVCSGQTGDTYSAGIYIAGDGWPSTGGVVRRNVVYGSKFAINVTQKGYDKRRYLIIHNTGADCDGGLQVLDPLSGAVLNNLFWSPAATLEHVRVEAVVAGETLTLETNLYGPEGLLKFGKWMGAAQADLAAWRRASGGDAHSIATDPLFANAGLHDYTLTAGSPAIDAGRTLAGVGQTHRNIGAL